MQANHTPGPWNIHESYPLDSEIKECIAIHPTYRYWNCTIAKENMLIAEVATGTNIEGVTGWPRVQDVEEGKANARVMMAAPELLEALTELRDYMWSEGYADQKPAMAKADAAIKKATDINAH